MVAAFAVADWESRPSKLQHPTIPEPVPERFAREVIARLDGPILRGSMRQQLMELADRLGLNRFEACLIIAQVQHRASRVPATADSTMSQPSRRSTAVAVAVAVGVQLLICATAWQLFGP
ncbi:MAG: hypothetical protein NZ561_05115 [Phycisphaerae bacterium]|nr:hypothetical protein [Phycisphaerae bacterium]